MSVKTSKLSNKLLETIKIVPVVKIKKIYRINLDKIGKCLAELEKEQGKKDEYIYNQ